MNLPSVTWLNVSADKTRDTTNP